MLHISPHSRPVTLVTGASAGIGASLARVFADQGHHVVLIARRASKLEALADEIAQTAAQRPKILTLDLTKPRCSRANKTCTCCRRTRAEVYRQQCRVRTGRRGVRARLFRTACDDCAQYPRSYRVVARFCRFVRQDGGWDPQRRIGRRLCAGPRNGSVFRHQSLRHLLQRGATLRTQTAGGRGNCALSRARSHRVSGSGGSSAGAISAATGFCCGGRLTVAELFGR